MYFLISFSHLSVSLASLSILVSLWVECIFLFVHLDIVPFYLTCSFQNICVRSSPFIAYFSTPSPLFIHRLILSLPLFSSLLSPDSSSLCQPFLPVFPSSFPPIPPLSVSLLSLSFPILPSLLCPEPSLFPNDSQSTASTGIKRTPL